MTSNKRNLKYGQETNQGQIRKESGNSATLYVVIIDPTVNANPNRLIFET